MFSQVCFLCPRSSLLHHLNFKICMNTASPSPPFPPFLHMFYLSVESEVVYFRAFF